MGQPGAPIQADRTGSRALWASPQMHAAAAHQRLATGQGTAVPGERCTTAGKQAREERTSVTNASIKTSDKCLIQNAFKLD
jgi:hypothetical protein